jgi:2-methylisocitrate lyase-like PEP mutase family enzyme
LLINIVQGGLTPDTSAARLTELGFRIAIHPSVALGAAAMGMLYALAALRGTEPGPLVPASPSEFFNLVGLAEWSELGERYRTEPAGSTSWA